ncbi:MAG: DUF2789 domain-containing protein [Gammaproteobacteria bacterium]|nr:DUF2789 domain-containing protein [Gammaproteobacteria bacterium]
MEHGFHPLSELFAQLGLANDAPSIEAFIARHRPLAHDLALADAPFWSEGQKQFLREALAEDADWAEAVDHLDTLLR